VGFALISVLAIPALSGCRETRDEMDRYLTAAHEVWGFQGAALVAHDGKVILSEGYGYADRVFGDPNTPETKFFIGSITKQFTAAAILLLAQDEDLALSDPIEDYLGDYPQPAASEITIHHLLNHTSGIPDYTDDPYVVLTRTSGILPSDLMALFMHEPLEFEPGTQFSYSNSSYIVLGAIIEEASGQSYEAYLHHRILKPLGMLSSGYARREMGLPQRAEGYTIDEYQNLIDALPVSMSILHTAGALYSTTNDMLLWDQALYTDTILESEWVDKMMTPYLGGYGYGWFIDSLYGLYHTYHGGFLDGFNTTFERWPNQSLCVVVFSNEDEAPVKKIAHGLAAIAFQLPYDMPHRKKAIHLSDDQMKGIDGLYRTAGEPFRYVNIDSATVYTWVEGQPRRRLQSAAVDSFFAADDNSVLFTFQRGDRGEVTGLIITDEGSNYYLPKLSADEARVELLKKQAVYLAPEQLDMFEGRYVLEWPEVSSEGEFVLQVWRDENQLMVLSPNAEGPVPLYPSSTNVFFHKVADFQLTFIADDDGKVTGCSLRLADEVVRGRKIE
jgi:CubicO group peptidase (beta-lactamase class C family)